MSYSELITLGQGFDTDNTLDTNDTLSDAIDCNGYLTEIQITVWGSGGDSDDVEVKQFNSLSDSTNGNFDTESQSLGTITLNGATPVVKSFTLFPARRCKVGLAMESGSTETPNYKGVYTVNSSINYRVFQIQ